MKREDWTITESSVRPLGNPDECFYCGEKVGGQHKDDCIMRSKTVVVNFSVDVVLDVPEHWDANRIDFRHNESSWCASNLIDLLKEQSEDRCLCPFTKATYLRDASEEDEDSWGYYVTDLES